MRQYKIIYPQSYIQRVRKFLKKYPELISQYKKTLELLELNPRHPSLRLHPLKGKLEGLHSVCINISYRIALEMIMGDKEIILVNVGAHEEVY